MIIQKKTIKSDLAQWYHGALFSPVSSTLIHAINKVFLATFPGLTANLISKHLPPSVATALGHINREKQNRQTTRPVNFRKTLTQIKSKLRLLKRNLPSNQSLDEVIKTKLSTQCFPSLEIPNHKTNELFFAISLVAYADLTGKFLYHSSRGNNSVLIAYHYDANTVYGCPLKNIEALAIIIGTNN